MIEFVVCTSNIGVEYEGSPIGFIWLEAPYTFTNEDDAFIDIGASELRVIADKLDELNGETK